jgi:cytidine deaminase
MREEQIIIPVRYCGFGELESDEARLIMAARDATDRSHSPYSHFRVGCAIASKDGTIFTGANVENASYGLTMCAERTTLATASNAGFGRSIVKIAITARFDVKSDAGLERTDPIVPCGACRQVMREFQDLAGEPMVILMDCFNDKLIMRMEDISSLLPKGFGPRDLGVLA